MSVDIRDRRRDRQLFLAVLVAWTTLAAYQVLALLGGWMDIPLANDFTSFWTGASLVRAGDAPNMFDLEVQQRFQRQLRAEFGTREEVRLADLTIPYFNPPPLALLLAPLTFFPLPVAYLLWQALGLLAFLAAVALPLRGRPLALTPTAIMLSYVGVGMTLLEGQVNWLFLLVFSLSLTALASGRPFLGGIFLGLLWLKPQYALLFPLIFLIKGRWRELAAMVGAGLALAALSLALIGTTGGTLYWELFNRMGVFYPPPDWCVNPTVMVNWRALLMNLWPGIPEATGSTLTLLLGAATMLVSLLAWRGPWDPKSPRFARQMLVATIATIVASPHSHFHGTVLLLAPVALTLAKPATGVPLARAWLPMLAIGYLVPLLIWPFLPAFLSIKPPFWLLVPYYLLAMGLLIYQLQPRPSPSLTVTVQSDGTRQLTRETARSIRWER